MAAIGRAHNRRQTTNSATTSTTRPSLGAIAWIACHRLRKRHDRSVPATYVRWISWSTAWRGFAGTTARFTLGCGSRRRRHGTRPNGSRSCWCRAWIWGRCTASRSGSRTSSTCRACRPKPALRCCRGAWRNRTPRWCTACGSRGDHLGQDGHHRIRLLRPAADAESVEPGAHAGRLQQRLRGRGRDGDVLAAVGSQTGGSITRPAAYCGVAGLKPTFGALDLSGVVPISRHLDHLGVLAHRRVTWRPCSTPCRLWDRRARRGPR